MLWQITLSAHSTNTELPLAHHGTFSPRAPCTCYNNGDQPPLASLLRRLRLPRAAGTRSCRDLRGAPLRDPGAEEPGGQVLQVRDGDDALVRQAGAAVAPHRRRAHHQGLLPGAPPGRRPCLQRQHLLRLHRLASY